MCDNKQVREGRKSLIQFGNTHLWDSCIQHTCNHIIYKQSLFKIQEELSRVNSNRFLVKMILHI